jgi:tripartite-type tricarboxylate transporter receptor subunit TctC
VSIPFSRLLAALLALPWQSAAIGADRVAQYPTKPIRLILPFAPGGGADLTGRLVAPGLTERLGQPVVMDNRPASAGILGAELAARAAPDGYTLLISTSSFAANPSIYKKLPYDVVKDFAPITLAVNSPLVVVVHPSVPAKTMQELIAFARANPNKLNYGSSGSGGAPHIAGEMLKSMARIEMVHITYKGIGPVLTALLGNEVQLTFSNLFVAQPHITAGRMRALAITSAERSKAKPEWPTVAESGLPDYQTGLWFGFMAPAATPNPIIRRLHKELVSILTQPELVNNIRSQGGDVVAGTPEAFARTLRDDIARYEKIIRAAGIVQQ